MTTITTRMFLAVALAALTYVHSHAEDTGFWSLELPVLESGSNSVGDTNLDFLTKKVSFDWRGKDATEIREFYSQFFESIGWENPMSGNTGFSDLNKSGWSSYSMRFDDYNKPKAVYGTMWKAKDYPAFGSVMVILNGMDNDELFGTVVVQVTPEVDMSALFRLNGLIGNDPKNLFKLHNAVNGNPFELHTIALPANYAEESDPLLAEYYEIVDEVRAVYKAWGRDYISE
jgi:hypothetical protein